MEHGLQTQIAKRVNISVQFFNEILYGRKNASLLIAKQIANITGSSPEIWQRGGGNSQQRLEAIKTTKLAGLS